MAKSRLLAGLISLVLLAGCSSATTATATLAEIPTVHVSPFALPLAQGLGQQYLQERGALPFDLIPTSGLSGLEAAGEGKAVLHLDFPPVPEGWFATPIGWEGIAIIVHPEVPIRTLTMADLAAIYSGRADDWQAFGRGQGSIQPVIPPEGDSLRAVFLSQVMPDERVTTLARLSPTPEQALFITQETEGAIAMVPAHFEMADSGISVLRLDGEFPEPNNLERGDYPLRVRVLAIAPEEPTGEIREWLTWVQATTSSE